MSKQTLALTAPDDLLSELLKETQALPDLKISTPALAEAVPASYRAPFGASPDDIMAMLKVVSLVFSTGVSVLNFVDKLVALVKKYKQPVILTNPSDPKDHLAIDENASAAQVKGWIERR
ncbi:MAG: hypothetical protein V4631_06305 [Pseudomonadota bacterium]